MTTKTDFQNVATSYGVKANYCCSKNTMFVSGEDDKRVKSFIRVRNLMGKNQHTFSIKQSK